MPSTDSVRLSIGREAIGSVGTAAAAMTTLRFTSEDLKGTKTVESSDEIQSTGEPTDAVVTAKSWAGSLNGLLSAPSTGGGRGNWDEMLEGALYAVGGTGTGSINGPLALAATRIGSVGCSGTSSNLHTFDITGGPIPAGTWVNVRGFANAENNGVFKVVSSTSTTAVCWGMVAATVVEGAQAGQTLELPQVAVPGDADTAPILRSYSIERYHTDMTQGKEFFQALGCIPQGIEISMSGRGPIQVRVPIIAKTASYSATTIAAPAAATNGNVLGGLNVEALMEGDGTSYNVPIGCINSFSINVQNGARTSTCATSAEPRSVERGSFEIDGSLSFLMQNIAGSATVAENFLSTTTVTALAFVISDDNGLGYTIELPEVTGVEVDSSTPGSGQDVEFRMTFKATKDVGGTGPATSIKISKFDGIANA